VAKSLHARILDLRSKFATALEFLLWAVTGAGKTEVLFPIVDDILRKGGRVLWVTPRRDVVDELLPRLAAAFPDVSLAAYRGGRPGSLALPPLVLATTHQTLRMVPAFSLVVVDEVDAFPLTAEPFLWRNVWRVAEDTPLVYLTATPPAVLLRRLLPQGTVFLLPRRFHGRPLPVPQIVHISYLASALAQGRLPARLVAWIQGRLTRDRRLYLFVPYVDTVETLTTLLRRAGFAAAGVSARTPERDTRVVAFREGRVPILVTTTILERGITVSHADVGVIGACAGHFDAATLIQMAGRAGRKAEDEEAEVVFFVEKDVPEVERAVRIIRDLNTLAVAEDGEDDFQGIFSDLVGSFADKTAAPTVSPGDEGDVPSGTLKNIFSTVLGPSKGSSAPMRCLLCGRPLPRTRRTRLPHPLQGVESFFCRDCLEHFEVPSGERCTHCGIPLRSSQTGNICEDCAHFWLTTDEPLRYQRSALLYTGTMRELLHAWKGGRNPALLHPFVAFLLRTYLGEGLAREGIQALVSVPSSPEGEIVRGFSPALLLAQGLGQHLGLPVLDVLSLEDPGGRQSARSRVERHQSERTVFYTGSPGVVRGLRLLLVDDVYTTGETLHRAARALASAGASEVYGLTLFRAVLRG